MSDLSNSVETYTILKKGLFPRTRAYHEFDKMENVKVIEITAYYDFRNPLKCEYKMVYKKK